MQLKPDELIQNHYVLLDNLGHKELVPFIRTYLKKRTKYTFIYYLSNLILIFLVGYLFLKGFNSPEYKLGSRFTYFSYGLAIAFALIPLHEFIHVLAYKSQGAKNTSYDVHLKKLYFMALADKFVINKKEFEIVALAPFVSISTVLIILYFVVPSNWNITIMGVLLAHTAMCSGDFGLLSYFEFNKEKNVVSYDDVENKISYFYAKLDK
ncbi:MAG: DUF3267 domain-containing protein [Saprospiraceae bacterium]|nr:DUF3267 domain-containing protein [Saprospiraceae bacterium]